MGWPSSAAVVFTELRPLLELPQQPRLLLKAAETPVLVDQEKFNEVKCDSCCGFTLKKAYFLLSYCVDHVSCSCKMD